MKNSSHPSFREPRRYACPGEEALNLFVDGELSLEDQQALFAHLAGCACCRRTLDGLLKFRRISRAEHLDVPPAVDEAFFRRLDQNKATHRKLDRAADRRPLWQARTPPISMRAAAAVALLVFIAGLFVPRMEHAPFVPASVSGEEERVELADPGRRMREAVYVFYPGLTVEAPKAEEWSSPTMLTFVPIAIGE